MSGIRVKPSGTSGDNGQLLEQDMHVRNRDVGGVVYSAPLKEYTPESGAFVNVSAGVEMAIAGGFAGTPVIVNNGGDTAAWTGSSIVGTDVDFTSTERPRTGSSSVHVDGPNLSDTWQFAKGSNVDLNNYAAITLWINVDRRWGNGDDISFFGWDTNTGTQIGDTILLEDYIDVGDTDVWQEAVIFLEDMNLQDKTIDAFRMQFTAQAGTAPEFFIDDFQIEETTTAVEFDLTPDIGKVFLVDEIRFNFVDAIDTTLLNASMPNLSYNQILGESQLNSGIFLQRTRRDVVEFGVSFRNINDFIRRGFDITTSFSDGTNTSITLGRRFTDYFTLDSREDDKIRIIITDDLSGLISFTAVALGKEISTDDL
jgi:hypothetical protein